MAVQDTKPGVGGDQSARTDILGASEESIKSAVEGTHKSLNVLLTRIRTFNTDTAGDYLDSEARANHAAAIAASQETLTVTETPQGLRHLVGTVLRTEINDDRQRVFTLEFPQFPKIHDYFVIGPNFARTESEARALFPQRPNTSGVGPASTSALTENAGFVSSAARALSREGIVFSYQRIPKP